MRGEELMMKYLFRWEKERIGEEGGGEISNGYNNILRINDVMMM